MCRKLRFVCDNFQQCFWCENLARLITWQTLCPSPLPYAISQAPCSIQTFLKALWSSFQWLIAVHNEMFSQSLLAPLLSCPSLPITLSVARHSRIICTALYYFHNKWHTLCHGIFISFKILVSQQHFPWAVWVIMGSLRNFPADYNNLNCYRIPSPPLHQYQQCMVQQFWHHQHILELLISA